MQKQKENTNIIVSAIVVIVVVGIFIFILNNKNKQNQDFNPTQEKISETQNQLDINNQSLKENNINQNNMESNTKTLNNFTPVSKTTTLEKIDLVVGSGQEVKAGATVSVHYTGAVAATGAVFQSSKDFGTEPITFPLSGVIKGWTDGIPGMKIGGTRRLIIPADQAYGANPPMGSGIPANADLVFDVELIAIK